MANTQRLSPQGYNINNAPLNENPFWAEEETGGNVPSGGLTGQALVKRSNADYDTEWKTIQSDGGLPAGGAAGDLLTKTESGAAWETPDFASSDDLEATDAIAREARTAATTNAAAITAETNRATAAEQANAASITAEASRAATAEASLSSDIAAVEQDVAGLDSALQDETDRAEAAESDLSGLITAESNRAQAAESSLSDDIDGVAADLSTEEANRAAADTQIRSDLTADITAEATTRAANDAALQTQIDQITGSIPTPAQLQEVPDVKINDVLQTATLQAYNASSAASNIRLALRQRFNSATQTWTRFWSHLTGKTVTVDSDVPFIGRLPVFSGQSDDFEIHAVKTSPISGGTTGQVLTKASNTDYDWSWQTPSTGGGDTLPDQTYNNNVITNITETATATASGKTSYLQQYFNGTQLTRRWKMMQGLIADLIGFFSSGSLVGNAFLMSDNSQSSDYGGVPVKPVYGLFRTGTAASAGQLLVASGGLNSAAVLTDTVIGGTAGQVLTKSSSNNYDWEWTTPAFTNDFSVLEPTGDKVKGFKTIPGLMFAIFTGTGNAPNWIYSLRSTDYEFLTSQSQNAINIYDNSTTRRGNYSDANYPMANGEFIKGYAGGSGSQALIVNVYDNNGATGTPINLILVNPSYISSASGGAGNPTTLDFDFNVGAATNNKVDEYDLSLVFGGSATSITSTGYTAAVSLAGHVEFKRFGGGTAAQNSGCIPFAVYDSGNNYYRIDNAGMVAYNFDGSTLHVKVLPNNAIASYSAAGASQWSSALCACQPKLIKTR